MVWHVSVLGELRGSGHGVLRHEIAHVCSGDFLLVHVFLTISPSLGVSHGVHLVVDVSSHGWHSGKILVELVDLLFDLRSAVSANWSHLFLF